MREGSGKRTIYFLLHVPKCAGTTVISHMNRHLGKRAVSAPRWGNPLRNFMGNRYPYTRESREVREVDVFYGHALSSSLAAHFRGHEVRAAVTLRDPVGYFVSLYNYRAGRAAEGIGPEDPEFETWYAAERRNPMSRFLLYRYFGWTPWSLWLTSSRAKLEWLESRFAKFWFVGSYRDVGLLVNQVSAELGIPGDPKRQNESQVRRVSVADLPADLIARIEAENALDNALFQRWKGRIFDVAANPREPLTEVPRADVVAQIGAELVSGVRKARIRRSRA